MPPIIHSGHAPSAALHPGRATEQAALAWPLGNTSAPLQGRHQTHCLSTPPSVQADKPFRSTNEASPPPRLCSTSIWGAPQSTLLVTCRISTTSALMPSYFASSRRKGSLPRGKGKDSFPPHNRCPMATKHQSHIPKPPPTAGQEPRWMAQLWMSPDPSPTGEDAHIVHEQDQKRFLHL